MKTTCIMPDHTRRWTYSALRYFFRNISQILTSFHFRRWSRIEFGFWHTRRIFCWEIRICHWFSYLMFHRFVNYFFLSRVYVHFNRNSRNDNSPERGFKLNYNQILCSNKWYITGTGLLSNLPLIYNKRSPYRKLRFSLKLEVFSFMMTIIVFTITNLTKNILL